MTKHWFSDAIDGETIDNMSTEQMREFCDRAVENDITIKDVLYSIMILARKESSLDDSLSEHIRRGYHR